MLVLLDNGHGGLINGSYQTAGKRFDHGNGNIIYEGEFNRAIVNGVVEQLTVLNIPYVVLAPEYRDVRLATRINRANQYNDQPCFYLSIHANAGGGEGSEIFTSPGNTRADQMATIFGEEYKKVFPERKLRTDFSDGDLDKERRFYVLTKTSMPAILTENFFMDNKEEALSILLSKTGREKVIAYHVAAIKRVVGYGL
ncbi:N-acetylmuramoyl-L-alanine amidase [Gangjinia marincola]|uniref:N-acetylmuramoyl-L-alanine amidase n=1 Tax=Gangjinia marincola TaxID=578463 RepID=A0ABP3XT45_9FLAO